MQEKSKNPLDLDLEMNDKEWILYWKLKYERAHMGLIDQKKEAIKLLNQRNQSMQMLERLPKEQFEKLLMEQKAENDKKKDT